MPDDTARTPLTSPPTATDDTAGSIFIQATATFMTFIWNGSVLPVAAAVQAPTRSTTIAVTNGIAATVS